MKRSAFSVILGLCLPVYMYLSLSPSQISKKLVQLQRRAFRLSSHSGFDFELRQDLIAPILII